LPTRSTLRDLPRSIQVRLAYDTVLESMITAWILLLTDVPPRPLHRCHPPDAPMPRKYGHLHGRVYGQPPVARRQGPEVARRNKVRQLGCPQRLGTPESTCTRAVLVYPTTDGSSCLSTGTIWTGVCERGDGENPCRYEFEL
jgi:hypothetical protein